MAELEQRLADLAQAVEWPQTPELALRLGPARPPRRRRAFVVVLATVALALAVAFAVPPARSAILRFLHLGGVTVERVETLPEAVERPLVSGLGRPVTAAEAEAILGAPFALPPVAGDPQLYLRGGIVSAVVADPLRVLVSQLRSDQQGGLVKSAAVGASAIEWVTLEPGVEAMWVEGVGHSIEWPGLPPRLAGNALLWERDGITFRLEGRALTLERAVELAAELNG